MSTRRSSASYVRRTQPNGSTAAQRSYLRALLSERDPATCEFPAMAALLTSLAAEPAQVDTLSIAGAEDFITALLSCSSRPAV